MFQHQTFLIKPWICVLVVLLAGCAVHSVHDRSYVSESLETRTGHELRPTEEEELRLPDEAALDDGLTEDEAVAIALWNNAQFQADLAMLGFAKADLKEAGMLQNPLFSLLFPWGPKQLEATLYFPFEFLWQRPMRVAAAKLDAERVADNLIQHGLNLVRDVNLTYAELLLARTSALIVQEEAALLDEIAGIAGARLALGDISGLEETAVLLEAARTQETSVRFDRDAEIAEERLKTILGLGIEGVTLRLTPSSDERDFPHDLSELLETAFLARPDLRAAEIAIEAAGARLGWERSKIFDLTAVLDANGEGKEGFEMGPGIRLNLPIFNWNQGRISRSHAEIAQAARQYLAVKHRISFEVREAESQYRAALQSLDILRSGVIKAAEASAKSAEGAYSLGDISYLALLDFRRQVIQSRLREAGAESELRRAAVGLKHSIGFKPDPAVAGDRTASEEGQKASRGGNHE
jgi:cobalt-zinc-cadmium efflux system outer membrane protein